MSLRFPDVPATTLPQLQRDVLMLFYQLGAAAEGQLIRGVEISSAGTKIAHGLRGVARSVLVFPKERTEGPPHEYQNADGKLIYLKAVPTTVIGPFVGGVGAGARTFAQADVGDVVEIVVNMSTGANQSADFESVITVDNQIQQTGGVLAVAMLAILKRPVSIDCDLVVLP